MDAANEAGKNAGPANGKETHKMAEANKAFATSR